VAGLLEALVLATTGSGDAEVYQPDANDLRPGSAATRELERIAAFMGAQFASEGATGFDVAAVLLELRDVVASIARPTDSAMLTRVFEWLTVVAQDAFAASGIQSLRERVSEQLEAGTPVVELLPKVPAVFLVGAPSTSVVDGLLARAWMLAVSMGAPCLVIDASGLAEAGERALGDGLRGFLEQAEGSALQVLLAGARLKVREKLAAETSARGIGFQHFERVDSAVSHALDRAGYLLMRRS
jgi:hypothetical protein